jgi:hypothetical protein
MRAPTSMSILPAVLGVLIDSVQETGISLGIEGYALHSMNQTHSTTLLLLRQHGEGWSCKRPLRSGGLAPPLKAPGIESISLGEWDLASRLARGSAESAGSSHRRGNVIRLHFGHWAVSLLFSAGYASGSDER